VFHAITAGSVVLKVGFLGILAAILVTVGMRAAWGARWRELRGSVRGGDRSLSAGAFGKIHPRWKTPYVSILVQAVVSGAILLLSQINNSTRSAYQILIDAAIILYFIPFLYMFAAVIKLAARKDRAENPHAILIPGGKAGLWLSGGLGFLVVLAGIFVSLVPPGDSTNKILFEVELLVWHGGSILLGLILYWRGVRNKRMAG